MGWRSLWIPHERLNSSRLPIPNKHIGLDKFIIEHTTWFSVFNLLQRVVGIVPPSVPSSFPPYTRPPISIQVSGTWYMYVDIDILCFSRPIKSRIESSIFLLCTFLLSYFLLSTNPWHFQKTPLRVPIVKELRNNNKNKLSSTSTCRRSSSSLVIPSLVTIIQKST